MHSKSNNIEFAFHDNANENVDERFESFLWRYQIDLDTSVRGSDFILDSVQLLHYKCHKINVKCDG